MGLLEDIYKWNPIFLAFMVFVASCVFFAIPITFFIFDQLEEDVELPLYYWLGVISIFSWFQMMLSVLYFKIRIKK